MDNSSIPHTAIYRRLERWSVCLAFAVIALALTILAGWHWDISRLKRPVGGNITMNPTTASTFLLSSLAFLGIAFRYHRPGLRRTAQAFAVIVLFIGAACITGYIFPSLAGIDVMLYPDRLAGLHAPIYDRMAITSAICFGLLGITLLSMRGASRRRSFLPDLPALAIGGLSMVTIISYIYHVEEHHGILRYFPMSLPSAISFLFLALSCLFNDPDKGIIKEFTGTLTGSVTARRLLPFAFLAPIILGLLRLYGYWMGYFTTEFGVTLLVSSIILCFVFVVWYNARLLNKKDTLRQKAEEALLATESRWKQLVSSVRDYAIFFIDVGGKVSTWNPGAEAIKGYTPGEIIGRPISVFYSPEDIEKNEPQLNLKMAELHGRHYTEGWRIRKDGSRFWAEIVVTTLYDDKHRLQGFSKITRDTTEQKLALEKIAYQARLIEDTSDALFSTDNNYTILTWNRAAESLFGYSAAEVIGRSAVAIMRTQIAEESRAAINRQLKNEGHWKGEIVYLHKSDDPITILLSVSATRDAAGEREGFVLVCRDVTEWKKTEILLREFNLELETQVKEKTDAIGQQNAELRALASHLQNIREEERASIAREVHDELGQQLTGLKMDFSWIAKRLRSGNINSVESKVQSTTQLLDATITTVRKIATELRPSILDDLGLLAAIDWQSQEFEKRSGIKTAFRTNLTCLQPTPDQSIGLFRICQEALTNVARHSMANNVLITLEQKDENLFLRIADDGRGLKPLAPGTRKTLGLLGMKERALMMGGQLEIDSTPEKGLALTINIPFHNSTENKP